MATLSLPAAFLEESAVIGLVTFANDATLYDNLLIWGGPMRQADDGLRPHQRDQSRRPKRSVNGFSV
jgi:hypothetical protein